MLVFASICPHPPIIVPAVGGENLKEAAKTVQAMQSLQKIFAVAKPEVVFLVSPHTILTGPEFNLLVDRDLNGSLAQFGAPEVQLSFGSDKKLARMIQNKARKQGIKVNLSSYFELDHASLVPLYYLTQKHDRFHLLVSSFSSAGLRKHGDYGQAIGEVIRRSKKKIAFIASGDLSHCLFPTAPGGYSPRGQEFDDKLVALLRNNDVPGILDLGPGLVEEAGECGLRSIVILLGALSGYKYSPEILSYEGPFGVGYLVANFRLSSKIPNS